MQEANALHAYRKGHACGEAICNARLFGEFEYAAGSWPKGFRVIHKAEVMDMGEAYGTPLPYFTTQTRLIRARPHTLRLNGCRVYE